MTLEEEFEANLRALADKSAELRRHRDICRKVHELLVNSGDLREILDLLASSWKAGQGVFSHVNLECEIPVETPKPDLGKFSWELSGYD